MTQTPHDTAAPPPPPPPPGEGWNTEHLKDYRLLRRSATDRKVAGVAGGLGRHLDVDPTVLRVLLVVLVFFGGAGLLLYGVMWLVVPDERTGRALIPSSDATRNALLIGTLVLAALVAIGDTWNGFGFPWPLALAAVVVFAVLLSRDSRSGGAAPVPGPVPPAGVPAGPAVPPATTSAYTAYYPPGAGATPPPAPPGGQAPPAWYPPPPPPPVRRPRRNGPLLFGITLALIALALGVLGILDASGAVAAPDTAYPALALAIIGAMLVLGSFVGRPGGLVALGLVAALVLGGAAAGNPSYDGSRDLFVHPKQAAAVQDSYDVPAGRIHLDLTDVRDLEQLDGRTIDLEGNVGEIVVDVPRDLAVSYSAQVHYGGAIEAPGTVRGGWDNTVHGDIRSPNPRAQVDLEVDLRFGHIELRQR